MTTQIEAEARGETAEAKRTSGLDYAVFGCLAAGGVGILKALDMSSAVDVFICLLGSVAAFGLVFYVHLRKH
jgi:hypothetical protein